MLPAAAQTTGANSPLEKQTPEQLEKTAEAYEKFLREPLALGTPQSSVIEVRAHLATVYFLLHRYHDSLDALRPVLGEKSAPQNPGPRSAEDPKSVSLRAQSWLVSGLDSLELNQLPDAIAALQHALAMEPKNATARMALGDALARSSRMEDAIKEYQEQTRLTPSLPDAWYKLGLAHSQISAEFLHAEVKPVEQNIMQQLTAEELIAKGETLNAARDLFRLLRQAPGMPEAHAELGTALLELGYANAAEDHFHKELTNNSESPLAHLGLAQTAALRGEWDLVRVEFEHLSTSNSREFTQLLDLPPSVLVLQAWSGGRMKLPERFAESPSGRVWKSWLSADATAAISANGKEDSAYRCPGNQPNADVPGVWLTEACYKDLVRQLTARKELSFFGRVKLAEAQFRLGQYDAALRTAKLLRTIDRSSGWGIYWMSKSHGALAEECFLRVGALNPDSARVHEMLGDHYLKLADYPKAKAEYQEAIRLAPDLPDLHLGLGTVLSRTSDWAQAEKELKRTLDMTPESSFAHYRLGHVYVEENLWEEAIKQLRQVPSDSTVLLSARLDLARAEAEIGQTSRAIEDLLSVAELDHDGEVYFRLAPLYRKMGDQERAREALATFKRLRAASLEADKDELGGLENEQVSGLTGTPKSP